MQCLTKLQQKCLKSFATIKHSWCSRLMLVSSHCIHKAMKNLNIDIILAFVFQQCVPYFQLSSYWYITINFVANGYSQKLILFV